MDSKLLLFIIIITIIFIYVEPNGNKNLMDLYLS